MTTAQQSAGSASGTVIEGNPIINIAFAEPTRYWHFGNLGPQLRNGRIPRPLTGRSTQDH